MNIESEHKLMRRVAGYHDLRMDGMTDLVLRARGASVLDVGCNRGLVGFELANNGATLVHGCDNYVEGIACARELFADLRSVESRFEVVDLTRGPQAMAPFGGIGYDIVLLLATYHKLKRVMPPADMRALLLWLGEHTRKWFAWRATSDKPLENDQEMRTIDSEFGPLGLKRVHTSHLSLTLGVCAVWQRNA
jgi:hypothetical protein